MVRSDQILGGAESLSSSEGRWGWETAEVEGLGTVF